MVIVSTTFVVTLVALVALVAVAVLAGVSLLAVAAGRELAYHRRVRAARHESIRTYDGRLALGH
jgi:heme exporter protein D